MRKRDGRLEPFDADKLNRALFAAIDSLGQPDPFLARELTDGVLHFLPAEVEEAAVSSAALAELVAKIVRELGQPALALAFSEYRCRKTAPAGASLPADPAAAAIRQGIEAGDPPWTLIAEAGSARVADWSLEHVFSRNLAAAHRDGLLTLDQLDSPRELAVAVGRLAPASASGPGRQAGVYEAIESFRLLIGGVLAVDSPERELALRRARIGDAAAFVRECTLAARAMKLSVVLNLNGEASPVWAAALSSGPLFRPPEQAEVQERSQGLLDAFVDQVASMPSGSVRADWHLAARDFEEGMARDRLLRLLRGVAAGAPVAFVYDRPRRPISLAAGIDRANPALVQWVGLDLPALVRRQPRKPSPEEFLEKLKSLARLAASAGVQKREYIRAHGLTERPAFLLDQARVGIDLLGLMAAARTVVPEEGDALAYGRLVRKTLQETLDAEERTLHIGCTIDDRGASDLEEYQPSDRGRWNRILREAGRLHAACGRGTVGLDLSANDAPKPADLLELLAFGWKQTQVQRILFLHPADRQRELWEAAR